MKAIHDELSALRGERDELRAEIEAYERSDGKLDAAIVRQVRENDRLRAELERMRSVIDAACEYRDIDTDDLEYHDAWTRLADAVDALRAYRAATRNENT
jgi:uncharacterized coiled-coil DUF342 family protein